MTINASNISPKKAIASGTILLQSMAALHAEDPSVLLPALYFSGEPGVGKTQIARSIASNLEAKLIIVSANQLSPEVAAGVHTMDYDTRTTIWMPPSWMPAEDGSDGPTVIFFDELASADDRVRKPLFGVFLDRELNGRKLPDNCYVMAAGNESETGTLVYELDNATRSRFVTFRIVADLMSWINEFAVDANITATTVSYLRNNMQNFCMTNRALELGLDLYGIPRSWHRVSNMERAIMRTPEDRHNEEKREALLHAVSGQVGTEMANEFMGVFDNVAQMTNLLDLLAAKPGTRAAMWPKNIGQLYALVYSMMAYPSDAQSAAAVMELIGDMPKKSDLPFADVKTPVLEVLLKRLSTLGVSQADIDHHLGRYSNEAFDALLANGPIIKLSAAA